MGRVSVVLLNWNGAHYTCPCIQSLKQSSYSQIEVVVVDNGSTDGSPDQIAAQFPDVALIRNPTNLGFAQGNNIGIDYSLGSGADYVLILNNDTLVDREMVSELVAAAVRQDDSVAVCPKIFWYHQPNRFWFAGSRALVWGGIFHHVGTNEVDSTQYESESEIGFATGCCILVPRKILESVGKFDPAFFIYCEDVDWSLRGRRAGFRMLYAPKAKLWHVESGTTRDWTGRKRYLFTRNTIWTVRRNGTALQKAAFFFVMYPLRALRRILRMALRLQWEGIRAELRGAKDGFLEPLQGAAQLAAEGAPCEVKMVQGPNSSSPLPYSHNGEG
jgi:hypothetical protein